MSIYLDHAATTPLDNEILEKILPYFTGDFGNADSPHAFGRRGMTAVDTARDTIAQWIEAKPNEIYFTSGGTESDNWGIYGLAQAQREEGKNHIILSAIEHHAALATAEKLRKEGFEITLLSPDRKGKITTDSLQKAFKTNTGLVAIMHANNETGVVQPIKELANLSHERGALFFTDAVQTTPYLPLSVKELGVDALSFSAHKFYGAKGCGVLYLKSGTKCKGLIVGGEQERGLRGGTTNVPAVLACGLAYEKTRKNLPQITEKMQKLRSAFLAQLSDLDGIVINGEEGLPALLNLRVEGVRNFDLVYAADLQGVCIAAGSACASASIKPSHVLLAMGLSEREAEESIRVSFGRENTEEEVIKGATILKEIILRLRKK